MASLIIGLWLGLVVVDTVTLVVAIMAIKVQSPANAHLAAVILMPAGIRDIINRRINSDL